VAVELQVVLGFLRKTNSGDFEVGPCCQSTERCYLDLRSYGIMTGVLSCREGTYLVVLGVRSVMKMNVVFCVSK
jgi:hypothetical protein